jgi:acyl-CoA thioester hydrolase
MAIIVTTAMSTQLFHHRVRVYWEDTDAGGVVFYANHLKYFERARTEWLRALGFSQSDLVRSDDVMFVVTHTEVAHQAPARLDDEIDISVEVKRLGGASITFVQQALRLATPTQAQTPVARGSITVGSVRASTFKPCRLPAPLRQAVEARLTLNP